MNFPSSRAVSLRYRSEDIEAIMLLYHRGCVIGGRYFRCGSICFF